MNPSPSPVRRALLSVSDKSGITEFARSLAELNIELLSTGGTYRLLSENGVPVTEIAEYTGFPEMMDGRVKTLHPKIHGGILGRRGQDDIIMEEHGIPPIDLVVVNLYPFKETISRPDCSLENAIENIDIGGPTMLRAAAKNHDHVAVIVDPADYNSVLTEIKSGHCYVSAALRNRLAVKTFEHTAQYDGAIANYLGCVDTETPEAEHRQFPQTWNSQYIKKQDLRYGENPHQAAAFYTEANPGEAGISTAEQLQGKALSYNNIADTDAALECVKGFNNPACVIVKHANPSGVAEGASLLEAYDKAYQTDPTSAFGGIIAFNRELDEATATAIIERQFSEVIIAPAVSVAASKAVSDKPNVRLLACGQWKEPVTTMNYKRVNGGLLVQDRDLAVIAEKDLKIVTEKKPSPDQIQDLLFAWKVVKYVKSNAIIYAKNLQTIGIGAGQMSRIYSARIAGIKAVDENLTVSGSVMASDAFFPFPDSVEAAAEAGITAIIQPGGAMKDDDVIAAADKAGIAMVFTGTRHFLH